MLLFQSDRNTAEVWMCHTHNNGEPFSICLWNWSLEHQDIGDRMPTISLGDFIRTTQSLKLFQVFSWLFWETDQDSQTEITQDFRVFLPGGKSKGSTFELCDLNVSRWQMIDSFTRSNSAFFFLNSNSGSFICFLFCFVFLRWWGSLSDQWSSCSLKLLFRQK